jgi:hypothetical protein
MRSAWGIRRRHVLEHFSRFSKNLTRATIADRAAHAQLPPRAAEERGAYRSRAEVGWVQQWAWVTVTSATKR